ncbi:hypothetical protein L7F22_013070 [Adiantum nelumboides]|nr:hypothetical protein [Adiantum nelumboides]
MHGDGGDEHAQKQQQEAEEQEGEIQEVASPQYLVQIPPIVGAQFALPFPLHLAVLKKKGASPLYNVGDFCFLDLHGKVLFLTSARNEHTRTKRVLLNSAGAPILSVHKKMLSFYNRWDAFNSDSGKDDDALFSVKKSAYFQAKTSLHVFVASQKESKPNFKIKRKAVETNLASEKDTFAVTIQPGVDHAFIAALILIMDEIHREQDYSTQPAIAQH